MVHKKVGTITLEYDRGDGVKISEAFQGEFNNAFFNGNVSAMEGTFSGTLTASAINAVKNLNLKTGSVATTTVSTLGFANGASHGFNDTGVWKTVHSATFAVPAADTSGGWMSAGIQYRIDDRKKDNDYFPTEFRILLDGAVVYTSPGRSYFRWFYRTFQTFFHEVAARITSSGYHTVSFQYRWFDIPTNVYPEFYDVVIRADYFRR